MEDAAIQTKCMDCEGLFHIDECSKYGNRMKCKPCHNAYRYCRDNVECWRRLSNEQNASLIRENLVQGGKGKKRELQLSTVTKAG